jgi:hypothetical protein
LVKISHSKNFVTAKTSISSVAVAALGWLLDMKQEQSHGLSPHWIVLDEANRLTEDGNWDRRSKKFAQYTTHIVFV